ncbi:BOX elements [hydrothermal vent metagenome]|uniref:BOX elements n=1 Tax=hydrothermal vent metagenome TaxID=652676 RepID=A0A1W1D2Z7_9ZZZZ
MQIIVPSYVWMDEKIISDVAIAFEQQIQKIAPLQELLKLYPDAKVTKLKEHSLVMPGLINAHVHIEFSANKTHLSYGDFINWLYSVIENREELIGGCKKECMQNAIDMMLEGGITTFGAVSSHGLDLEVCAKAPQNVVFFNELIGSQAMMADVLFGDFKNRLENSKKVSREGFYPAVAIHSPYSVHPILIQKALEIVKKENLKLTAHFMESQAERDWLDKSDGDFKEFFEKLLNQKTNVSDAQEFLDHFHTTQTLLTHVVKANDDELAQIAKQKHTIIHCPISNRLLGNGAIDLSKLDKYNIQWIVATDGLSSNYTLDLFEEMKIALFMQSDAPLLPLAKKLFRSVTKDAAKALGLNTGEIKEQKNADMIVLELENKPNEEFLIHLLLHRYPISRVYINGALKKSL